MSSIAIETVTRHRSNWIPPGEFDLVMLQNEMLNSLKLARYEFHLRAQAEGTLPPFLGSTLRGAFGHALKSSVCSMSHGDCSRCLLWERCLYPRLFETVAAVSSDKSTRLLKQYQDAPRPFVFMPPLPSTEPGFLRARDDFLRWRVPVSRLDTLIFGLTLFGPAIDDFPYIVHAIRLMAQRGFGAARIRFSLVKVLALDAQGQGTAVYDNGSNFVRDQKTYSLARLVEIRLAELEARSKVAVSASVAGGPPVAQRVSVTNDLTLRFLTPTRLRMQGRVLDDPSFAQLVKSSLLRFSMLTESWGVAPTASLNYKSLLERAQEILVKDSRVCLIALDRYSNRHRAKLLLDGFIGDITFTGFGLRDLLPLIVAGEFLHIGSGAAFGLGRYMIVS